MTTLQQLTTMGEPYESCHQAVHANSYRSADAKAASQGWHPTWCEGHVCRGSHHGASTSISTPYGELSVTPLYEHGKPMVEVDILDGEHVAASLIWPANEIGGFSDFLSRFAPTYADPIADLFTSAAITARTAQPWTRSA